MPATKKKKAEAESVIFRSRDPRLSIVRRPSRRRTNDLGEIEIGEIGPDFAALERLGVGVISQHGVKLHFRAIRHGIAPLSCFAGAGSSACAVFPELQS